MSELDPEKFNSFFIGKVEEIVKNLSSNYNAFNYVNNLIRPNCEFNFAYVTVQDVYSTILGIKNNSCLYEYSINGEIFKIAAPFICEPLTHIYNNCIEYCVYPDVFKFVKVISIFKSGHKSHYSNYRPISIIPVVSKIHEMLLYKQIIKHFEDNSLLDKNQFGFRKKS